MAKSSSVGKLTKVSYMSAGVIIGSMFGGAALASAGWWYTDRLNLEFSEPVGINEASPANGDCTLNTTGTNTFTDENGDLVTQKVQCIDDGSKIERLKLVKNRSGYKLQVITEDKEVFKVKLTDDGRKKGYTVIEKVAKTLNGSGPRWKVTEEKKVKLRQDLKSEVERRK